MVEVSMFNIPYISVRVIVFECSFVSASLLIYKKQTNEIFLHFNEYTMPVQWSFYYNSWLQEFKNDFLYYRSKYLITLIIAFFLWPR